MFWPFTVWLNCSSDLKTFANSQPSASNFKSFSLITRTFFSHSRSKQFWKQNIIFACKIKVPRVFAILLKTVLIKSRCVLIMYWWEWSTGTLCLGLGKKGYGTKPNTKTQSWFWLAIPKLGFGCTLSGCSPFC